MRRDIATLAVCLTLVLGCRSERPEQPADVEAVAGNAASDTSQVEDVRQFVHRYIAHKFGGAFLGGGNPHSEPFWSLRAHQDGPSGEVVWVVDTFYVDRITMLDDTSSMATVRYPRAVEVAHPGYVGEVRSDLLDEIVVSSGLVHSYDAMIVGQREMREHIETSEYVEPGWQERIDQAFAKREAKDGT